MNVSWSTWTEYKYLLTVTGHLSSDKTLAKMVGVTIFYTIFNSFQSQSLMGGSMNYLFQGNLAAQQL